MSDPIELRRKILEKQGYRLVGKHSAIKVCHWTKQAIRGKDVCYKKTFYNINSWQCIQATVTLDICNLHCQWCWRDISYKLPPGDYFTDNPKDIVAGFIEEQKKILKGFFGNKDADQTRADESMRPKHVALSLTGDACMYPKLPELVEEFHKNGMTTFIVTNGTFTDMVRKLIEHQPTQLYITMPAPNKKIYIESCKPYSEKTWDNIIDSMKLLKHFKRGVVRLTLANGLNMIYPEQYAEILKDIDFAFLELKSAMPVGYARYRLTSASMPTHNEIKEFARIIAEKADLKLIDEKENSKVVLLMRKDTDERMLMH